MRFCFNNENITSRGNAPLIFAINLCNTIGLSTNELAKLYNKYAQLNGKLKQTFVSDPDKISYISGPYGVPLSATDPEARADWKEMGFDYLFTPTEFINDIRNKPEKRKISKSEESIDELQARFVKITPPFMDPKAAQDIGLENFYYYAREEDKKTHEQLKKEMDDLVKDLIYDALKKNRLKIKGTKIQDLYNKMEKTVAKEQTGPIKE